jgi:hypothetical protein
MQKAGHDNALRSTPYPNKRVLPPWPQAIGIEKTPVKRNQLLLASKNTHPTPRITPGGKIVPKLLLNVFHSFFRSILGLPFAMSRLPLTNRASLTMGAVGGLVPRPPFFTFAHVGLVYSASGISTRNLGANPKPLEP